MSTLLRISFGQKNYEIISFAIIVELKVTGLSEMNQAQKINYHRIPHIYGILRVN